MGRFRPALTIAIPAHNAAHHLKRTLPLLPIDPEIEILVVANGCTDNTIQVASECHPQAKVIELPVASVALARDVALKEAHGHYVAFRDADDEVIEGGFEQLMACLDVDPTLDLVGGAFVWVEQGQALHTSCYAHNHDELFAHCLLQCPLHLASSMLRKSRFQELPLCPLYPMAEDWAYLWQAFTHGRHLQTIPEVVLRYIRHTASVTATVVPGNTLTDFVTVLRSQFLQQCGICLTATEMMVFVNTTPCIHWELKEVPFLRTLAHPYQAACQVYEKITAQNRLVPQAALENVCMQVLETVKTCFQKETDHLPNSIG